VFGSRFAASPQRKVLLYWHSVANRLLTWLTNILNDINITDMETCFKAVRAEVLKQIPLTSERFGIEPELTTRLAQGTCGSTRSPSATTGAPRPRERRSVGRDAVSAAWCLLKYRFFNRRFTTHEGYYVLQSVRRARGFNKWMLSQFKAFVGERVYEAGCGIGNFTELLLDRERLVCVDYDPFYAEVIARRFGHMENVRAQRMDLTDPDPSMEAERFDTVISLNVIEHIEDDRPRDPALLRRAGPPAGTPPCSSPRTRVYTLHPCDKALGHFRRYTESELREKFHARRLRDCERPPVQPTGRPGVVGKREAGAERPVADADADLRAAPASGQAAGSAPDRAGPVVHHRRPQARRGPRARDRGRPLRNRRGRRRRGLTAPGMAFPVDFRHNHPVQPGGMRHVHRLFRDRVGPARAPRLRPAASGRREDAALVHRFDGAVHETARAIAEGPDRVLGGPGPRASTG